MTETDIQRINFCAKVFKAFGLELIILADRRIIYQVGGRQYPDLESLELKAEGLLKSRTRLR